MALAIGTVIVTTVAGTIDGLIAETLGVALLAGSGAFDGVRTMGGVSEVISNADVYLSRGEQAFLAVTIIVILAPIMEEGFKGLFTALAMPARASASVAFTTGVCVGAGFGVLEASLYGLGGLAENSTIDWWSLMLLRAGATSMHALNTGLLGLALYAGMQGRGVARALVFYFIAVGFHALWNGLSILAGSRFIFEFNDLTDEQLSWIAFAIMAPLGIAVMITLWVVARATYRDSAKVGQATEA
jgi:RsiW-degrading membrane proteinase PrsW (M82 family)